jgi:hypothetical protein
MYDLLILHVYRIVSSTVLQTPDQPLYFPVHPKIMKIAIFGSFENLFLA